MFVMGVLDVLSLCIYTIITAVLGIIGSVYCSAPEFNYVLGAFAMCMSDLGILFFTRRFSLDDIKILLALGKNRINVITIVRHNK